CAAPGAASGAPTARPSRPARARGSAPFARCDARARAPRTAAHRTCATCRTPRRREGARDRARIRAPRLRARRARSTRRTSKLLFAEGATEAGRLEPRFGQLAVGIRVEHDAPPGVIRDGPVADHCGADRQPELHIPARVEEAERATVDPARPGLDL